MDQVQLIQQTVRRLLTEMREHTLKAGVDAEKYDLLQSILDDGDQDKMVALHNWLDEVRRGAYDDVLRIWERHKPETWKMYEVMEVTLNEHRVLDSKRVALRKAWKEAPRVKAKKTEATEQDKLGQVG
jgi:hypothetical protein